MILKADFKAKKAVLVFERFLIPCEVLLQNETLRVIPYGKPLERTVRVRSELPLNALEKLLSIKNEVVTEIRLKEVSSISFYYIRNPRKPVMEFLRSENGLGQIHLHIEDRGEVKLLLNLKDALKLRKKISLLLKRYRK
ncbi:MAG: hypothetical protein J7L55_03615 [Desulfurococcales archaeon]|nr:hypothetical protein [Desulfurococcales archaeon]